MGHAVGRLIGKTSLGIGQAEHESSILEHVFYRSGDYKAIESRTDPRCFIIGRTGSGKSAALKYLEEEYGRKVIRITPEDLSLPYIVELGAVRYLGSLDVNLDLLFTALWKHVLLVELIRNRYNVDSPVAKMNILANIRDRVKRDPAKRAALDYLDEFGGKFWCETHERVREITESFEQRIEAESFAKLGVPHAGIGAGSDSEMTITKVSRRELADRFQRVVNQTQMARLNKMITVIDEDILDRPQYSVYVVIDDLDRDWVDERLANDLIRCLFDTVLSLSQKVRHLKVLVALRTNIFHELDFGARCGQEEKFRSLVLQMRWSKRNLEQMLDERVRFASKNGDSRLTCVADLLPPRDEQKGSALDYILERTLMRPRDAILFVNECLDAHSGQGYLAWNDVINAEFPYSEKRLLALRDEWKPTYPGISKVLDLFRGASVPIVRDELSSYLDDAMLLPSDLDFEGIRWMTEMSTAMWSSNNSSWIEVYHPLTRALYDIGFLGFTDPTSGSLIYSHDQPEFADIPSNVARIREFVVHPTYHLALNINPR